LVASRGEAKIVLFDQRLEKAVIGGSREEAAPGEPAAGEIFADVAFRARSGVRPGEAVIGALIPAQRRGALATKLWQQFAKARFRHVEMEMAVDHASCGLLVRQAPRLRRMRPPASVVRIGRKPAPLRHGPFQFGPAGFDEPEARRGWVLPGNGGKPSGDEAGIGGTPPPSRERGRIHRHIIA
jgi:hypothetical protein